MILFLISLLLYIGCLLGYKPDPKSLKDEPISFMENFSQVKASLFTGIILIITFLVTTNFTFLHVNQTLFSYFGLSGWKGLTLQLPFQIVTHLFIHVDVIHFLPNLAAIGVLSAYERRVGASRFLTVLLVSSFASILSLFFYLEEAVSCGISGGIFGLAVAYFTDHPGLTLKEWLLALAVFVLLVFVFSASQTRITFLGKIEIDHIAHVLGVIAAIVYCKWRPVSIQQNDFKSY
jgi:rhomboid protease GluP